MENLRKTALAFCEQNPLWLVDISECLKRGGKIHYAEENALLVEHTASGILMLGANDKESGIAALERVGYGELTKSVRWLVAREGAAREAVYAYLPVSKQTECFQIAYLGKDLPTLSGALRFQRAEREEIETIKQNYSLESPENIERLAAAGVLACAFDQEENFVGFIGEHPEGSMGMLHVFPQYRRRGYAEEIEKYLCRRYLSEGRVPYGHVITDNAASLALQKKLGCEVADKKIYWLRIEDSQ